MGKRPENVGFTMLELIVVVILVGILSSIALIEYTKTVERSRISEARITLGNLRSSANAYKMGNNSNPDIEDLTIEAPTACIATHYFRYVLSSLSPNPTASTATRCTAGEGGKTPDGPEAYIITLDNDTGVWGGTPGRY
jgi:prepilin-type N-terminal cleavage/methylation domain-containing protein